MEKKNQIKGLKSLLAEAAASEELTKIPEGVEDKKPAEATPAVKTDEVKKTVAASDDVKPVTVEGGKDKAEVTVTEGADGVVVPEGTAESKPETPVADAKKVDDAVKPVVAAGTEAKPVAVEGGNKVAEVAATAAAAKPAEAPKEEAPKTEEAPKLAEKPGADADHEAKLNEAIENFNKFIDTLHEETTIPVGTEDKVEEKPAEAKTEDAMKEVAASEDVKPVTVEGGKDKAEVTVTEEAEGVVLPEGTLDKKPAEETPEVKTDEVKPVVAASDDVKPVTVDGGKDKAEITEGADGVVLPEGTVDKKPEEATPEVKTDEVIHTTENADDVKPVTVEGGKDKAEVTTTAVTEEAEGVVLPEGTLDKKPAEATPEVKIDEVKPVAAASDDVKPVENVPAPETKEAPAEKCDDKGFTCIADVIKAGTCSVDTPEKKQAVVESVAILLASENKDLMYEEYAGYLAKAKTLREHIIHKYSVIAGNRTDDLFESMSLMEAKIKAAKEKKDLFKPVKEQQEINKAEKEAAAKPVTPDEAAFGKVPEAPKAAANFYPAGADSKDKKDCFDKSFNAYAAAHAGITREDYAKTEDWKAIVASCEKPADKPAEAAKPAEEKK